MTSPLIVGLDLSLTSTGVALADGSTKTLTNKLKGAARIAWIVDAIMDDLQGLDGELVVVIEAPFMPREPSRVAGAMAVLRLHACIEDALYRARERWAVVPPATLKKYSVGHGNAPKGQMLVAAVKRLDYDGHSHDEADALFLREMALDHYGVVDSKVPKASREMLAKINWPVMAGEGPF